MIARLDAHGVAASYRHAPPDGLREVRLVERRSRPGDGDAIRNIEIAWVRRRHVDRGPHFLLDDLVVDLLRAFHRVVFRQVRKGTTEVLRGIAHLPLTSGRSFCRWKRDVEAR